MNDFDERLAKLVQAALQEDIGDGDHSTLSSIPAGAPGKAILKVKQEGIAAGIAVADRIFRLREPSAVFRPLITDGQTMQPGQTAFEVEASIHTILQLERLVLNIMQRMSGIATLTSSYVELVKGYHTKILDTRKTTPNFRLLEKEAVRIGGGVNHRMGLYDLIMLQDNHLDFAGGLEKAIQRASDYVLEYKPGLEIEVETRNLDEVRRVVQIGKINRIMLDNFSPGDVAEAVRIVNRQFITEASGGINYDNIVEYAKTGVDFISVGALIHQAKSLDLSLKAVIE